MPTEPKKPLIVISYAHADEPEHPGEGEVKWLSFVTGYLRPAIKHGAVDLWIDRLMPGGADWEREIEQKLRACDIFIVLVSRHSLSSDYVVDKEIAIIRERQAKAEDVRFYPLILTPTPKIALDLVGDKNLRPRDGKPLSDYSINERYRHMSDAADEIAKAAREIYGRKCELQMRRASETRAAKILPERPLVDRASLTASLKALGPTLSLAIAARSALRVLPAAVVTSRRRTERLEANRSQECFAAIFRSCSLAWFVSNHPEHASIYRGAANSAFAETSKIASFAAANEVAFVVNAAASAAAAVFAVADGSASKAAISAADAGIAAAELADGVAWNEVQLDFASAETSSANRIAELPLWSRGAQHRASYAWNELKAALAKGEDWEVWIDWYEERLRGGSRGEEYELVFASVPQEEWDKGPAAANAWISTRLKQLGDEQPRPKHQIDDEESLRILAPRAEP